MHRPSSTKNGCRPLVARMTNNRSCRRYRPARRANAKRTTFLSSLSSIHTTQQEKTIGGSRRALNARRVSAVDPPPRQKNPPGFHCRGRLHLSRDRSPHAGSCAGRQEKLHVSPFVVALCPAPPVSTRTRPHCLAGSSARPSRPASTQATLPLYGVSITWRTRPGTGNQPGSRRGSCVSHVHRPAGHVTSRC